jgi:probable rRNA maturation factor
METARLRTRANLQNSEVSRGGRVPRPLLFLGTVKTQMKLSNSIIIFEKKLPGLSSRAFAGFALKACRAAGLRGDVSVLITGNSSMRRLNSRFRGKSRPTDVLSFPAASANGFAGDIAISLDIAERNARLLGHSVADEIRILILHGILHLAGYDHESDKGEMAKKEILLRRRLALPTSLIERSDSLPTRKKLATLARAVARSPR